MDALLRIAPRADLFAAIHGAIRADRDGHLGAGGRPIRRRSVVKP